MIPSTVERVPEHTADSMNDQIRRQTEKNIECFAQGGPEAIRRRLEELDQEWDIERTLEANAASVSLAATILGATVDRRFFYLPAVVGFFLLQHAVQGWCPPLPIFRRFGFRTAQEIDREREALKTLLGGVQDRSAERKNQAPSMNPALVASIR